MKITVQRLSTKDLATLTERTIAASKNPKHKVIENNPLLVELESIYKDYDAVYAKNTYSGKGLSVAEADKQRDRAFVSIKNFLTGYQQIPTAPNADKAKALYELLTTFDTSLDKLSYSAETAQLKKLIEAFSLTENIERLTALGIHIAFEELKTKQETFESIFAEQTEANAELRKLPSASSIRRSLEKSLKTYLGLLSVMQNQTDWKDLYAEISELVKAAKNSTTTAKKTDEGTEPKQA